MSKTLLFDSAEAGELWEASGMLEHSVAAVEASWAKVFAQEGEAWIGDLNQACFETLRMRDVREATPFHGLGKAG